MSIILTFLIKIGQLCPITFSKKCTKQVSLKSIGTSAIILWIFRFVNSPSCVVFGLDKIRKFAFIEHKSRFIFSKILNVNLAAIRKIYVYFLINLCTASDNKLYPIKRNFPKTFCKYKYYINNIHSTFTIYNVCMA